MHPREIGAFIQSQLRPFNQHTTAIIWSQTMNNCGGRNMMSNMSREYCMWMSVLQQSEGVCQKLQTREFDIDDISARHKVMSTGV